MKPPGALASPSWMVIGDVVRGVSALQSPAVSQNEEHNPEPMLRAIQA